MIRAIAIDDEPIALRVVAEHAAKIPFLSLQGTFTNAFEAINYLKKEKIDLLFLDINMPDISGIDFLKALTDPPLVIFTTAYSEYALESYELDAIDYLLKPFEFGRFLKAINKANEKLGQQEDEALFVKSGYEYHRIRFDELKYLKAEGNYIQFVSTNDKLLSRRTMKEAEEQLRNNSFIKVHRSFLINTQFVNKIEKHQLLVDGDIIPINQEGFDLVKDRLGQ